MCDDKHLLMSYILSYSVFISIAETKCCKYIANSMRKCFGQPTVSEYTPSLQERQLITSYPWLRTGINEFCYAHFPACLCSSVFLLSQTIQSGSQENSVMHSGLCIPTFTTHICMLTNFYTYGIYLSNKKIKQRIFF